MTYRSGILVVQRYAVGDSHPVTLGALNRKSDAPLEAVTRLAAYKGFEGISWPNVLATLSLDQGLASLDELEAVRRYVDSLPRTARYEILHCSWVGGDATPASPSGFVSVGFDVGNYESEDSSYSAVLHELMFGKYSQLAEYRRRLNEDQLFWSIDDARGFLRRREHLIGEGFDLETDDNSESAVIHVAVAIR